VLTPREQDLSQWALGHAKNLLPDRRRRFLSSIAGETPNQFLGTRSVAAAAAKKGANDLVTAYSLGKVLGFVNTPRLDFAEAI